MGDPGEIQALFFALIGGSPGTEIVLLDKNLAIRSPSIVRNLDAHLLGSCARVPPAGGTMGELARARAISLRSAKAQSNIHQDQIWLFLTGEVERLQTLRGFPILPSRVPLEAVSVERFTARHPLPMDDHGAPLGSDRPFASPLLFAG